MAIHTYEVRPRKDKRGVDLISEALPFGALWYGGPNSASNAVSYAKFYSRSKDALISVFDFFAGTEVDDGAGICALWHPETIEAA